MEGVRARVWIRGSEFPSQLRIVSSGVNPKPLFPGKMVAADHSVCFRWDGMYGLVCGG